MTHQLLFSHGPLSASQVDSVRTFLRQGYVHALLVSEIPPFEWMDKNFEVFWSTGEDCMGNEYPKQTMMWGCCDGTVGRLFFLKSKKDYEAVLRDHADKVIDANPFQTSIDAPLRNSKQRDDDYSAGFRDGKLHGLPFGAICGFATAIMVYILLGWVA